jgi:hypothetical protein
MDYLSGLWQEIARPDGPMAFRFYLQPAMSIYAIISGRKDARNTSLLFWALFTDPRHRVELVRDGWKSVRNVFLSHCHGPHLSDHGFGDERRGPDHLHRPGDRSLFAGSRACESSGVCPTAMPTADRQLLSRHRVEPPPVGAGYQVVELR